MDAKEIELYLTELGTELHKRGVEEPLHFMIIGGAYMLAFEHMLRTTEDIDIFWLETDEFQNMRSIVSECMLTVARKRKLRHDWFNFLTQAILQRDILIPPGKLWKKFGPLHIHVPPREYILALKILAGRDKDLVDCGILLSHMKIQTRQQAQERQAEQIQKSMRSLFPNT